MILKGLQILPEKIQLVEKVFLQGYYFPLFQIFFKELIITFDAQNKSKPKQH